MMYLRGRYRGAVQVTDLIWLGQQIVLAGRRELERNAPGVPIAELVVMGDLIKFSPSSITEIASRTGYAQSRVSTAVSSIVGHGWATTRSDARDGRRTLVDIADEVTHWSRTDQAEIQRKPFDDLLDGVTAKRRETIERALQDLLDILRARSGPASPD